uniref:Uncharacterized protein n=1 Tax=Aegilops tauschii subsp. strangulata TaxID=200361 RepID=A0A453NBU5_AEGTS
MSCSNTLMITMHENLCQHKCTGDLTSDCNLVSVIVTCAQVATFLLTEHSVCSTEKCPEHYDWVNIIYLYVKIWVKLVAPEWKGSMGQENLGWLRKYTSRRSWITWPNLLNEQWSKKRLTCASFFFCKLQALMDVSVQFSSF